VFNLKRYFKHRKLKHRWDLILPGMTVAQAEQIMGFDFSKDSDNAAGRVVYSNHAQDYLPFYLVVDRSSGKIVRRHNIRALDEL
jgi:hypothetical protein